MKPHIEFNHFMWLKVTGKLNGMRVSDGGGVTLSSEELSNYIRNTEILKEHGVEYPHWEDAKKVLDGIKEKMND